MIPEHRSTRPRCWQRAQASGLERWPNSLYAPQRFQEGGGPGVARGKTQSRDPSRSHQLRRHHEQPLAKTLQGSSLQVRWDAETFEPVQQVVSPQYNLEERLVGLEVVGGNLPQRIGILQFSDDQFRPSAPIVKAPKVEGLQSEVGDQSLVAVAAPLEQGQLCRRFFRHGATDDHEASQPWPPLRTILEFPRPHSRRDPAVAQSRQATFQWPSEPSHDRIESQFALDKFHNFVVEKGGVGPHPHFADRVGQPGEGALQQGNRDGRNVGGARMVTPLPTILRVPFQAEQGKIGGPTALFRVVGHLGLFLATIDRQDRAVQIEDRWRGLAQHRCAPGIVQLDEGVSSSASEPIEEASQSRGIGIARQARQIMKNTVVAQGLGGLDPAQPQDQRVEQRFQRLADAVTGVPLWESDALGKRTLQPDALEELFDERHAAELREPQSSDADMQMSWSTGHYIQTSLLVWFACSSQNSLSDRSAQRLQ